MSNQNIKPNNPTKSDSVSEPDDVIRSHQQSLGAYRLQASKVKMQQKQDPNQVIGIYPSHTP
jgi:hypothetical protein